MELALIDTGAQWSLIGGELAELVETSAHPMNRSIRYHTRFGPIDARFFRLAVDLVADEGNDLSVDATVLLASEWVGPPVVLGYRGFLERVRLALDPGARDNDQWLGFGGLLTAD